MRHVRHGPYGKAMLEPRPSGEGAHVLAVALWAPQNLPEALNCRLSQRGMSARSRKSGERCHSNSVLLGDPLLALSLAGPALRTECGSLNRPINEGGDVDDVSSAEGEEYESRSTPVDELGDSLKACSAFLRAWVSQEWLVPFE